MLLRKGEGSGRHAAREFEEGNDGPSEGNTTNEDAEISGNKLEKTEINGWTARVIQLVIFVREA